MERDDEKQIGLAEGVVCNADGRHDHRRTRPLKLTQDRKPEIQMPIVPPRDQLVVGDAKDRPRADGVADLVVGEAWRPDDVGVRSNGQTAPFGNSISQQQSRLDPPRMMPKDAEKDVYDAAGGALSGAR